MLEQIKHLWRNSYMHFIPFFKHFKTSLKCEGYKRVENQIASHFKVFLFCFWLSILQSQWHWQHKYTIIWNVSSQSPDTSLSIQKKLIWAKICFLLLQPKGLALEIQELRRKSFWWGLFYSTYSLRRPYNVGHPSLN